MPAITHGGVVFGKNGLSSVDGPASAADPADTEAMTACAAAGVEPAATALMTTTVSAKSRCAPIRRFGSWGVCRREGGLGPRIADLLVSKDSRQRHGDQCRSNESDQSVGLHVLAPLVQSVFAKGTLCCISPVA